MKCLWVKIWPDLCSGLQVTSLMAWLVKNLPAVQQIKEMACSIPGLRRFPGEGNGYPVFLPGKSHEQRSLADYSPWSWKGHT